MGVRGKRTRRRGARRGTYVGGEPEGKIEGKPPPARRPPRVTVRAAIWLADEERSAINLKTLDTLGTIENYARGFPVHRTTQIRIERELHRMGIERTAREKLAGQGRRRRVVTTPPAPSAEGKAA